MEFDWILVDAQEHVAVCCSSLNGDIPDLVLGHTGRLMLVALPLVLLAVPGVLLNHPRPATRGTDISVAGEVGVPFQAAASASLVTGAYRCDDQSPNFCELAGAQLQARIGTAGASLGVGAAWFTEYRLLGGAVLANVVRTWHGPFGDPWLAPPSRTLYGIEVQASFLFIGHLFGGLLYAPARSGEPAGWHALAGVGVRLPVMSAGPR